MKSLLALLFIVSVGVFTFNTTPHIKVARFNESSRMESIQQPEMVKDTAPEIKPIVEPVEQPEPLPQKTDCSLAYDYDWPQRIAYAVCMAESHGRHTAVGDTNTQYPSCGLMQIRTLPGRPSCEQLKDPSFNMRYAYNMWVGQGFRPWSAYTQGWYIKYL